MLFFLKLMKVKKLIKRRKKIILRVFSPQILKLYGPKNTKSIINNENKNNRVFFTIYFLKIMKFSLLLTPYMSQSYIFEILS